MNYKRSLSFFREQLERGSSVEVKAPRRTGLMFQTPIPQQEELKYDPKAFITEAMRKLREARDTVSRSAKQAAEESSKKMAEATSGMFSGFQGEAEEYDATQEATREQLEHTKDVDMDRTAQMTSGQRGLAINPEEYSIGDVDMGAVAQAIKDIESGGGNYSARGPKVEKGMYAGERAMGAYQVMPGNLPQWSKEALGREVTEEEFMASPEIQDRIFLHQAMKSLRKNGNVDDIAAIWFTGQPVSKMGNVSDGGTTAPDYLMKFRKFYHSNLGRS